MQKNIYEKQLKEAEQYCKTLEENFTNNLEVIEEREREIQVLSQKVAILQEQNQTLIGKITQQQQQNQFSIRLIRNQYGQKIEEKQKETEEVAVMIETKMRKQVESVSQRFQQELKSAKAQVMDRDESSRRLLQENNRLSEIIKDQKSQLFQLQSQVTLLNDQRNAMSNKMALHEQELQGIKNCNSSWEEMLKDKLKEAQKDKQALQQEYSDYKITVKEKLRRQKEDLNKKIIQLSAEKEDQIREIAQDQKQLKYKLQKSLNDLRDCSRQLQLLKEEKGKLEVILEKYKENQLKSNFQKNQKQYQYLLKIFEQDKRDLRNQIDVIAQQKKFIKQQLDEANSKRQSTQKAVERLKVQLLNKSKQNDDLKKQNRNLKHEFQAKSKEYELNMMQLRSQEAPGASYRPVDRPHDSKGFDIIESVRMQNDYSKVFTEDMGIIDDRFFQSSALKSPKQNRPNAGGFNQNRQAQLMKKVSELQLEIQQYKTLIKKLRDEAESLKKFSEQEKNREISLYRDKANIYWEKANDKEQQVMSLRQQYNQLKSNYQDLTVQLKKYRQNQSQNRAVAQQLQTMKDQIIKLQRDRTDLEEQIQIITKDRDLMEEISSELRAENHSLRQIINPLNYPQNYQQSNCGLDYQDNSNNQAPPREATVPFYQNLQPERQIIPKKLHELVREKKMLSISGRKAVIQEREAQTRMQHIGTESQKQMLERLKVKNKTPPKIANYAEMKKDKQRRSHQIETVSQKQVFQRLKRQTQAPIPQKGINYLQLRQLGAQ